jgi:ubiquinone/menaquinone biosynthesis C-methylase UbiE
MRIFHVGEVSAMPFFEAEMFDIVIDGQCLHCLIGEDRCACLAEVRRVLRPGGVFFVSSMVAPPKSDDARACFDADRGWLLRDGKPYRTLKSLDDLASELSRAGFAVEEHSLGINPWWDHAMMVCRKPRA